MLPALEMTTFQQDLIKVALDKLLLGVIAAIFGFFLSRLLEDYRAKNSYTLALLQQRNTACRELMPLVVAHHTQVLAVWAMLQTMCDKHPEKPTKEEMKPGYDYVEHYKLFKTQTAALVPFVGGSVAEHLTAYLNEVGVVADLIKGKTPDKRPTEEGLIAALTTFQVGLNNELGRHAK